MVTTRPYKGDTTKKRWECDIRFDWPDPTIEPYRKRPLSPVTSKSGSQAWGENREKELLRAGPHPTTLPAAVPTLAEFIPRFLQRHGQADQQARSTQAAQESVCRIHLIPRLGSLRLDQITTEIVQDLKYQLQRPNDRNRISEPGTINNVLKQLSTILKMAQLWKVIAKPAAEIVRLKLPTKAPRFHSFAHYAALIAATQFERDTRLITLLGGDAGLRAGEMMALQPGDCDLKGRQLKLERSVWKAGIGPTKGRRVRFVPMTVRLTTALTRRLRERPTYIIGDGAEPVTLRFIEYQMLRVSKRAGVQGGVHILRHTFCSHLAMRGAPARVIQELAGHANIATTERYMHLSPMATTDAIRLLEQCGGESGDIVETA